MPHNPAPNFIQKLRAVRLSDDRRGRMRAELLAYADLHAVTAKEKLLRPSPYYGFRMFYGVSAFMLLILVGGGGAAYASGDSLPGDFLYPMKVAVAEPVETVLARTPEKKAEVHVELAERRLEEATQLAAKNKLDQKTQDFIAKQVDKHVATSDKLAVTLESTGKSEVSFAVRSDLEARLTAHAEILNLIGDHFAASSTAEETGRQARTLASAVRVRQQTLADIREARTATVAVSATTSVNAVIASAKKTDAAITTMSADATSLAPAAVDDHVDSAKSALTDVRDQLASDQPRAAARTAEEAARASEIAAIILKHDALLKSLGIGASTTASTSKPVNAATTPVLVAPATSTATTTPAPKLWFRLPQSF